jgi:hypothetical protein
MKVRLQWLLRMSTYAATNLTGLLVLNIEMFTSVSSTRW